MPFRVRHIQVALRDAARSGLVCALALFPLVAVLATAPTSSAGAAPTSPLRPHFQGLVSGPGVGYWLAASDGGIFNYGGAKYDGAASSSAPLNKPVVGMAPTPSGGGYWEVATDGGIFSFGDAKFYGSTGAMTLNKPIVAMASTPDGRGYWLVASDGGIFNYGDAKFFGSTGGIRLDKPIVSMASTPDGRGYWLTATDGGIFSFGDAKFYGSTGGIALAKPIVGMSPTSDGKGYWLVASDGGIFGFGDAKFFGSTGGIKLNKPIVGMAATLDGGGYWLVATDGGIFSFGDAKFYGSAGSVHLVAPIVGMAVDPQFFGAKISSSNIVQVSCPTTSWCAAVDGKGHVITYQKGAWSTPQLVDPGSAATDDLGDGSFNGISCASTTFCVAVSYLDGDTVFNGTSWSPMSFPAAIPNASFSGIACSTATFCVASQVHGGGALFESGVWSATTPNLSTTQGLPAVSCVPGQTVCMMVDNFGHFSYTTNGTNWSAPAKTNLGDPDDSNAYNAVACLPNGLCHVVDSDGYAGLGGPGGWTPYGNIDQATTFDELTSISCDPTGTVCVSVDTDGNALVLNQTAPWSSPMAFDTTGSPTTVSCASPTFCVAADSAGYAYTFDPIGTGPTL